MDIEQLKMILEVVKSTGDGAFTIAIIYFSKEILLSLLDLGVLVFFLCLAGKIAMKIFNTFSYAKRICALVDEETPCGPNGFARLKVKIDSLKSEKSV